MKWKVTFYHGAQKQLAKWPVGIQAAFTRIVDLIELHGPNECIIPFSYIKPLGNKLFEIRAKGKEGIARAFFCATENREVIILHNFIKKTQKTPKKELVLARKRLKEILKNG